MASVYTDRLTDLSHVAGTGLRTHVDAGREKGVSGPGCLFFKFRSSVLFLFSAVVRACGLVVLPVSVWMSCRSLLQTRVSQWTSIKCSYRCPCFGGLGFANVIVRDHISCSHLSGALE